RHVDSAGPEPDPLGLSRNPSQESDAGGNVLGLVGHVLADIAFRKTKLVSEQKRLAIFVEGDAPIFFQRVDRHREETQIHTQRLPGVYFRSSRAARRPGRSVTK